MRIPLCPTCFMDTEADFVPCRKVGIAGHEQWAAWAAKALGAQLCSSMQLDPALAANIPLRGWADTVVTHVNFHIPKCLRNLTSL